MAKTNTAAPARPEALKFKPADIAAQQKKRAAENKRTQALAAIEQQRKAEHLTAHSTELLIGKAQGEIPRGPGMPDEGFSAYGSAGRDEHDAIFGEKPIPGDPTPPERILHQNGVPLTDFQVALIGYANTDEGKVDPEVQAEIRELREGKAKAPARVTLDERDQQILRRAENQNRMAEQLEGKKGEDAKRLAAMLFREHDVHTNPRTKLESANLRRDQVAKWFGPNDDPGPYEPVKDKQGRPVKDGFDILYAIPRDVHELVQEKLAKRQAAKFRRHAEGKRPARSGNEPPRQVLSPETLERIRAASGADGAAIASAFENEDIVRGGGPVQRKGMAKRFDQLQAGIDSDGEDEVD